MPRLFLFAIGGTGARVLKSLTFLLAAGVRPQSPTEFEIVPVIIDPHRDNHDLIRTRAILSDYQAIRTLSQPGNDGFFGTQVTTFDQLLNRNNQLDSEFTYDLAGTREQTFRKYIDYGKLDDSNKAFADILFSGSSVNKNRERVDLLDLEMDIGFVGNPNVGSVVLNQFRESKHFREFANNFAKDDRVFIISSIFGGTGAAGFPVILKNIRNALNDDGATSRDLLTNAKIGAISVLPYFNVKDDKNSPIQKSHFIAKAKSALYYYRENVTGNRSVNAMYYIADEYAGNPYPNDPGHSGQRNDAHFVELASALAIVDFLSLKDSELASVSGSAKEPLYRGFALRDGALGKIEFSGLYEKTEKLIALRLSQFLLFQRFCQDQIKTALDEPWCTDVPVIDGQFLGTAFFDEILSKFLSDFRIWLDEMARNKRAFAPFDPDARLDALFTGRPVRRSIGNLFKRFESHDFNNELNNQRNVETYTTPDQKLIRLFFLATQHALIKRFGFGEVNK